ncbi:MAG: hypothetical protein H6657_26155 [Ardenticatenaceae bacterium]|nr:hypothetical protein [Ardenticatenaceae bacterium]
MTSSEEKLAQDLEILQVMADQMDDYVRSETLFWPMGYSDMPMLTLGGYWLRQHRLTALRALLTSEQQSQLDAAVQTFNTAVSDWVVRTEQRAHTELEARIRQWGEYLRDLADKKSAEMASYPAQVEVRAIIAALVNHLQQSPYALDQKLAGATVSLDKGLRARFASGEFVWPEEWQPAYPEAEYWYLYGRPKA